MTRIIHRISIVLYVLITFITFIVLSAYGYSFYKLPLNQRYDNQALYSLLNPGGLIGHYLGIVGTILIVVGLFSYMARKRMKVFSRLGILKYWLEFHIFLSTWGTVMVLFHTSFKFGGIVSIGFWSLVIVWVSGVIGRFIYLQIPRSMEGRELTMIEVKSLKNELDTELQNKYNIDFSEIQSTRFSELKPTLLSMNISKKDYRKIKQLIRTEQKITKRIERLDLMHNLLKYWHVAHLPFALIMLAIMVIHVVVVLYFAQILSIWIK